MTRRHVTALCRCHCPSHLPVDQTTLSSRYPKGTHSGKEGTRTGLRPCPCSPSSSAQAGGRRQDTEVRATALYGKDAGATDVDQVGAQSSHTPLHLTVTLKSQFVFMMTHRLCVGVPEKRGHRPRDTPGACPTLTNASRSLSCQKPVSLPLCCVACQPAPWASVTTASLVLTVQQPAWETLSSPRGSCELANRNAASRSVS